MSDKIIRPFHCGSQASDWDEYNCIRCAKSAWRKAPPGDCYSYDQITCDIERTVGNAAWDASVMTEDIAERMGFLDNSPPRQKGWSYNWRCKEFQETKESA